MLSALQGTTSAQPWWDLHIEGDVGHEQPQPRGPYPRLLSNSALMTSVSLTKQQHPGHLSSEDIWEDWVPARPTLALYSFP